MAARFDSTCAECGETIRKDLDDFANLGGTYTHLSCAGWHLRKRLARTVHVLCESGAPNALEQIRQITQQVLEEQRT